MTAAVKNYTFRNTTLAYTCTGNGDQVWFAFHGFGQDHRVFEPLSHQHGESITLYSFALFFHGSELSLSDQPIEKEFWKSCMEQFMVDHAITQISVVGFSLGARMALSLLGLIPDKIKRVHVLAPDGIHMNFWYSLATGSRGGRKLFKLLLHHHHTLFSMVEIARKLGLIDERMKQFVIRQLGTREKRDQVYQSWIAFRHLQLDQNFFHQSQKRHHVTLTIVLAKNDTVINNRQIVRRMKHAENTTVLWLSSSHNRLIEAYISCGLIIGKQSGYIPKK